MMDYKITAIDQERNIVELDYTYNGETTHKRMQVYNSDTKEAITAEVEEWATNFVKAKEAEVETREDVTSLIGKKQTVEPAQEV